MSEIIEIIVNGQRRFVPAGWVLADLIESLEVKRGPVAVELNEEIVRRSDWPQQELDAGDQVEIVHFVGGGERYSCPMN
jgi:thiamine biosynthesis protein ThiS